jgi:hypothetical protein
MDRRPLAAAAPTWYLDSGRCRATVWPGKESSRCQPGRSGRASAKRHARRRAGWQAGFGSALPSCPTFASSDPWEMDPGQSAPGSGNTTPALLFCLLSPPSLSPHVNATAGEMPPMHLANPSPKRKREQPPLAPLLNTTLALRPASTPPRGSPAPSSGADSPRNAVADQLRGMTLAPVAAIPMSPLTPTDDAIRKRPKLDAMRINSDTSLGTHAAAAAAAVRPGPGSGSLAKTITFNPELAASREIPETPQAPRPRIVTDIAAFAQPTTFMSSRGHASSWQSPPKKQAPSLGSYVAR